jgi:hypothetical protein
MATTFHPGVSHGHTPARRWKDIQDDPNSPGASFFLIRACKNMQPKTLIDTAVIVEFRDKPIALQHLNWYLSTGKGADFVEDANIKAMLERDTGVQAAIAAQIPSGTTSGVVTGAFKLEQSDYVNQDFRFAFGAIDELDFEADFGAKTLHVWFQDRYEWHPFYPGLYTVFPDDAPRQTNCVHAALVELKDSGAADFWMKGEATVPLSLVVSPKPPASTSNL